MPERILKIITEGISSNPELTTLQEEMDILFKKNILRDLTTKELL